MKLVILESPYSASNDREVAENIAYARECVKDSLSRGESPIASHLLLTQPGILDDLNPDDRKAGIAAGHAWYRAADACVIYADHGFTAGMRAGVDAAVKSGVPIQVRYLVADSTAASIDGSRSIFYWMDVVAASRS